VDERSGLCPYLCQETGDTYVSTTAQEANYHARVSLLFEHEDHIQASQEDSVLFAITSLFLDSVKSLKGSLVALLLQILSIVPGGGDTPAADSSRSLQELTYADRELENPIFDEGKGRKRSSGDL